MIKQDITVFQVYPFRVGQKIHIEGGARHGDWEVIGVSERKVRLRCPVSNREYEWDKFCFFLEERHAAKWPQ